jgi:hypothetical protein
VFPADQATPCPADVTAPASAIPGASPSGATDNPPSLRLALTARGTRAPGGDLVEYRITARPVSAPLRDVTVTARLTCVPGDVRLAGRPWATAGRATAGPRAVTWRLDLGATPQIAGFAIRVRPGARGGPIVGELAATGPVSNCPALRAADTPVDAHCRVTVLLPGGTPAAAQRRPVTGAYDLPRPGVQGAAPALPVAPPPAAPAAPAGPMGPATTGPGAVVALPVLPGASPNASPSVASQAGRPPAVPAGPESLTEQAVPPRPALTSPDTSRADLVGRAFAFLIGGLAFLLVAVAVAGGLAGGRLRRDRDDEERKPARPRADDGRRARELVRRAGIDAPRPGHAVNFGEDTVPRPVSAARTLPDVVRRTAEAAKATDPPRSLPVTAPALGHERLPSGSVVDERARHE